MHLSRLLARCLLLLMLWTSSSTHAESRAVSVLFIASYHPGFPTFFRQVDGLRSVFDPRQVRLDIEFLDAKRFVRYEEQFQQNLEYKLAQLPPYDIIISGDDAATFFATRHRDTLFANTPIIFFGVNDLDFGLSFNQVPQVTGVLEKTSNRDTIQLMRSLFGAHTPMTVITDATPTGMIDTQHFENDLQQLRFTNYRILSLAELSFDEFMTAASRLKGPGTMIIISCHRDRTGVTHDFASTIAWLRQHTRLPIFHLWSHGVGDGILGGKVVSHYNQARTAAQLAQEVIDGRDIASIPVVSESPNKYLFDYAVMQEFNLRPADMPLNSQFVNLPAEEHPLLGRLLWLGAGSVTVLALIVIGLLLKIRSRQRREAKVLSANQELELKVAERTQDLARLNNETGSLLRLRNSMLDNTVACIVLLRNDTIQWVNQHTEELFGYQPDELIGRSVATLYRHAMDHKRVARESPAILRRGETYQGELTFVRKDGSTLWALYSGKALNPDDLAEGVLYVLVDFTARKSMEDQLKKMNQTLETLAITDHLTGIRNRRYVTEQVEGEIQRYNRYQSAFSLILVDIDHFKSINDQFGHATGDDALIQVANILQSGCRKVDTVGRWGGEEFMILCPETSHAQALQLAEILRQRIMQQNTLLPTRITASFGVATYQPLESLETLLRQVDAALYQAKEMRNCVRGYATQLPDL